MLKTKILTLTALMVTLGFGSSVAQPIGGAATGRKPIDQAAASESGPGGVDSAAKAGAKRGQPSGKKVPNPKLTKQQAKQAARQAKLDAKQAKKDARLAERKAANQHGKPAAGPGQQATAVPGLAQKTGRGAAAGNPAGEEQGVENGGAHGRANGPAGSALRPKQQKNKAAN